MIDVIIPAYNAHDTIEQTLFSIAYQDLSELCNVIIIDDNSNKNYQDIVERFNNIIKIKLLRLQENKGPGYARQYGINNSNSKFILFIDSDDILSSPYSINILYNEIKDSDYDLVISNFEEELDEKFVLKENDTIWLHGKIYRRSFLQKNKIFFNNSRFNEDNGFNQLILLADSKIRYINKKTYIWRNNKKSITRRNNYKFRYDGTLQYIFNIKWALELAIKRQYNVSKIAELAFSALVYLYFIYLEFYEKSDINNILVATNDIRSISLKYPVTKKEQLEIIEEQYLNYYNDYTENFLINPVITFNKFLKIVEESSIL